MMRFVRIGLVVALALAVSVGVAARQKPASIKIDGLVDKPGTFDAKSFAGLKRLTVKADDHGEPAVARAADDYVVSYSLAELDPGFTDRVVILADRRDGKPLAENAAPFQIVVPGEKKHGRWIRQVVSLTVKDAR
jgi:DMSO/TMAO reductase YedYZ molybdopterin-dependent catalytic subunit